MNVLWSVLLFFGDRIKLNKIKIKDIKYSIFTIFNAIIINFGVTSHLWNVIEWIESIN